MLLPRCRPLQSHAEPDGVLVPALFANQEVAVFLSLLEPFRGMVDESGQGLGRLFGGEREVVDGWDDRRWVLRLPFLE